MAVYTRPRRSRTVNTDHVVPHLTHPSPATLAVIWSYRAICTVGEADRLDALILVTTTLVLHVCALTRTLGACTRGR